jgi:type IV secretory pathway TraG/TraD family ATPase VirD4
MRPIEEALLYLAGYDVRFWFFVQDVSQLKLHYKNSWQSFFANTGTQCFFGISDIDTANLVSDIAGITTVAHPSYTYTFSIPNMGGEPLYYRSKYDGDYYQIEPYSLNHLRKFFSSTQDGVVYRYNPICNSVHYDPVPSFDRSSTVSNTSRPLITPDEVMRLPEDEQIVFMKGISPILCHRIPYYRIGDGEASLQERSNIEPPDKVDFV